MDLSKKKCAPCEKGTPPLTDKQEEALLHRIQGWELFRTGVHSIKKRYPCKSFAAALGFVMEMGLIAQAEGHHPVIHIYYDKVDVEFYTHAIGGLSGNDFILAAKFDATRT